MTGSPIVTSLKQKHRKSRRIVLTTRDDDMDNAAAARRYRALYISDIHLGTKACQAHAFLDFLRCHDADRIFLIGDIVDFWRPSPPVLGGESRRACLRRTSGRRSPSHQPCPRWARRGA